MSGILLKLRMLNLLLLTTIGLVLAEGGNLQAQSDLPEENQCIVCHEELDYLPEDFQEYDVHLQTGLSCAGCHGGDASSDDEEIAMSVENGFIGVPSRNEIPQFCGRCHSNPEYMRIFHPGLATDQVSQYYTSVHGKQLLKGDKKVAECVNCHSAHSILPASDPRSSVYPLNVPQTCKKCHSNSIYMEEYRIPSNQYELYSKSVHGIALLEIKDIGAPACNDCHGNHGAIPPGVSSISFVCGNCHVNNMVLYRETTMAKEFEELGFHGCEQCHGYHAVQKTHDDMVGITEKSSCIECHNEGDAGYESAKNIYSSITNLVTLYDSASLSYEEVKLKGMNDVDIGFLLQEGKQKLIESRTLVHTFDDEKVSGKTKEGETILSNALNMADKELDEYQTRRRGFAIATIVFIIFALALYLKIRDIEKKKA